MKHTLFIFALLTASIQTFAQSPRIKLNQITKDSVTGSVLISSPTDSGMVYSRDLFISYGADTVLILGGDTLAATSSIISSVVSDGVTIIGDGTLGSELTADTSVLATLRALSDSLALVISSVTADGVTITGDGTVGSPLEVDTATVISSVGRLLDSLVNVRTDLDLKQDQLNGTGFVKATGTTITYDNSTYLTSEVDGSVTNEIQDISTTGAAGNIFISSGSTLNLNVDDADASASNEGSLTVGAGTASTSVISSNTSGSTDVTLTAGTNVTLSETGNNITISASGGGSSFNNISETVDTVYIDSFLNVANGTLYVDADSNRIGINRIPEYSDFKGGLQIDNTPYSAVNEPGIRLYGDYTTMWMLNNNNISGGYSQLFFGESLSKYAELLWDNSTDKYQTFVLGGDILFSTQYVAPNIIPNLWIDADDGYVGMGTSSPSVQLELSTDGAKKLSTSTWATGSDRRIKKNIINYNKGLNEIIQLNPVEYELNGKANTINGAKGIGLIAQEVQPIIPEAVTGYYGKLNQDDESDTYLYNINTHSFFFMFINAFKEQQAIIETQATKIENLKTLITELSNRLQILENN